jgi:hypothetical protein
MADWIQLAYDRFIFGLLCTRLLTGILIHPVNLMIRRRNIRFSVKTRHCEFSHPMNFVWCQSQFVICTTFTLTRARLFPRITARLLSRNERNANLG